MTFSANSSSNYKC